MEKGSGRMEEDGSRGEAMRWVWIFLGCWTMIRVFILHFPYVYSLAVRRGYALLPSSELEASCTHCTLHVCDFRLLS